MIPAMHVPGNHSWYLTLPETGHCGTLTVPASVASSPTLLCAGLLASWFSLLLLLLDSFDFLHSSRSHIFAIFLFFNGYVYLIAAESTTDNRTRSAVSCWPTTLGIWRSMPMVKTLKSPRRLPSPPGVGLFSGYKKHYILLYVFRNGTR